MTRTLLLISLVDFLKLLLETRSPGEFAVNRPLKDKRAFGKPCSDTMMLGVRVIGPLNSSPFKGH